MLEQPNVLRMMAGLFLIFFGYFIARFVANAFARLLQKKITSHQVMLLHKISFYAVFFIFFMAALQHLGFKLNVLLGATGILTVALGFASQTSIANLISGLFLIAERPFAVGDTISVNTTVGEVLSIDILSVKLKMADNTLARIPNETLIKSEIINLSHYPLRRYELLIGVCYESDLEQARNVILTAAKHTPHCLKHPEPQLTFYAFGEAGVQLQLLVWAKKEEFLAVKNGLGFVVKKAFDDAGLEMPSTSRPLYITEKESV